MKINASCRVSDMPPDVHDTDRCPPPDVSDDWDTLPSFDFDDGLPLVLEPALAHVVSQ